MYVGAGDVFSHHTSILKSRRYQDCHSDAKNHKYTDSFLDFLKYSCSFSSIIAVSQ